MTHSSISTIKALEKLMSSSFDHQSASDILSSVERLDHSDKTLSFLKTLCFTILGDFQSAMTLVNEWETSRNLTYYEKALKANIAEELLPNKRERELFKELDGIDLARSDFILSKEHLDDLAFILAQPIDWIPKESLDKIRRVMTNDLEFLYTFYDYLISDSQSNSIENVDSKWRSHIVEMKEVGYTKIQSFFSDLSLTDSLKNTADALLQYCQSSCKNCTEEILAIHIPELNCSARYFCEIEKNRRVLTFGADALSKFSSLNRLFQNDLWNQIAILFANGRSVLKQFSFIEAETDYSNDLPWLVNPHCDHMRLILPLTPVTSLVSFVKDSQQVSELHKIILPHILKGYPGSLSDWHIKCQGITTEYLGGKVTDVLLYNSGIPHRIQRQFTPTKYIEIEYEIFNLKANTLDKLISKTANATN